MALALLGGLTGLDGVSFVQSMIARPVVAGPLAGLLLGDPQAGMMAGVVLEIISLHQLPIGASRHWDTGPAAVVAALAMTSEPGAVGLIEAVGFGVMVGWTGSWTIHMMRRLNGRLVVADGDRRMSPAQLTSRHLAAMAVDFLRATLLTLVATAAVAALVIGSPEAPRPPALAAALCVLMLASLALGADVRQVARGLRVWTAFAAGGVASLVLWLWLL